MKTDPNTRSKVFQDPATQIRITRYPSMAAVFFKALLISPFRSNIRAARSDVQPVKIRLDDVQLRPGLIRQYCRVCGYNGRDTSTVPMAYLQTLFIGLLGRYITSGFFPFNPLGLIQISQSFETLHPVKADDVLNLSCTLDRVSETQKGIETDFLLQAESSGRIVWQGTSRYLSRIKGKEKQKKKRIEERFLEKKETIDIPAGTGRKYAAVSGDFNPHHLYSFLAKLFGFKRAIAHGMFSLARVLATLENESGFATGTRVEAEFKLPVLMPAVTALGYETGQDDGHPPHIIRFELRDDKKGVPHLKGRLFLPTKDI